MDEVAEKVNRWRELQVQRLELEAQIAAILYPPADEPGLTMYVHKSNEVLAQVKPLNEALWPIADEQERIVTALGEWMIQNHE